MSRVNWKSVLVGVAIGGMLFASVPVIADVGDAVLQGQGNVVDARTTLRGDAAGANFRVIGERPGTAAVSIFTEAGTPPLKVNRKAKVANLNADLLDGRHGGFYAPAVAQPNKTIVGTFAAAGDRMIDSMTFDPPLPNDVPQSAIHYVAQGGDLPAECPGNFMAAAGHLCIYAAWDNNATYSSIGSIENSSLGVGASKYGFTILWTVTGSSPNVRGNWAYTTPAAAPGDVPIESGTLNNPTPTPNGMVEGS